MLILGHAAGAAAAARWVSDEVDLRWIVFFAWLVFRYMLHEGRRLRYVLMSGRLPSIKSDTSPTATPSNLLGGIAS